jgi:multidrug efflux system membrane fusion protein
MMKGTFPNSDRRLWPGQFVNVLVKLATDPGATVVPTAAVQAGNEGVPYVYLVKPDRTVEPRPVVVTRTDGINTIVKSGINPGDTVVTDGQLRLVPGARIVNRSEGGGAGGRAEDATTGSGGAKGEGGTKGGARGEGGARGSKGVS